MAPREGQIYLGDGGYLIDPEDKYGARLNSDLVELASLDDRLCVVLLGEPGTGKSTVLSDDYERLEQAARIDDAKYLYCDLRSFGSEDRIVREVFQSSRFEEWKEGTCRLFLYLDSLDECTIRVANLAALLVEQLRAIPHERLILRLACRTAEWPAILETGLRANYGQDGVDVMELAPLRKTDVSLAAEAKGLSPAEFLQTVHESNAAALAIKPITLDFLLKIYREQGTLPSAHVDLYEKGCTILCEEKNPSRRAANHLGALSASERMDVACWIGFATVFSAKGAVWMGPTNGVIPTDQVDLAALALAHGYRESDIREVLASSGLFSSRGLSRLGWAHKTYAEFLAARFVSKHKFSIDQVRSLVFHHEERHAVVPQLVETAAWIANMRSDVFWDIASRDPQVLLSSDVAKADDRARAELVQSMLGAFDRHEALDDNWDERRHYGKLRHPGLSQQLRPFIIDQTKNVIVRRVAIDIAEACGVHELQEELISVTLDPSDDMNTRQQAIHAIAKIGDAGARVRLKPVIFSDCASDPQDELRGVALGVLYPDHLPTVDIFEQLTPRRDNSFLGAYSSFVFKVIRTMSHQELPVALRWAASRPRASHEHGPLKRLEEAALTAGWKRADEENILPGLVKLVSRRLVEHESPFGTLEGQTITPSASFRRLVSLRLLTGPESKPPTSLIFARPALIDERDLPWLLEEFELAPSSPLAPALAEIIALLLWRIADANTLDKAVGLALAHEVLRKPMSGMLDPILLDSPRATELREDERAYQESCSPVQRVGVPDLAERIERGLTNCETGMYWHHWWQLSRNLQLTEASTHQESEFDANIMKFPGWVAATEIDRERIVQAARRYILEGDPSNEEWFSLELPYFPALAGYRALELLRVIDPSWTENLEPSVWEKWAPVIVCYPDGPGEALAKAVAVQCPDRMLELIGALLDKGTAGENERVQGLGILDHGWTKQVAAAILQRAEEESNPRVADALIEKGLEHGDQRYVLLAENIISRLSREEGGATGARATTLLSYLASHALANSWNTLWQFMRNERTRAREVWLSVANRVHRDVEDVLDGLSPSALADLYIWLRVEFREEGNRGRERRVLPIAHFRDGVLRQLQDCGDWQCIPALERVVAEFPTEPFLKFAKVLGRRAAAQNTWRPLSIADLGKLAKGTEWRVVQSEQQLLEVVLESLGRFQSEIHGELSPVRDLWDKCAPGKWRPVDEEELSDRIVRSLRTDLEQRGIVANREVKIRKGRPGLKGQQTDIYVDALVSKGSIDAGLERVSLVVEVKGCWHKEVQDAMATQLVNRYLRDNACNHGIYLVGWFLDEGWDGEDYRKGQTSRNFPEGIVKAHDRLTQQAAMLSVDGKTIAAFVLDARLERGPTDVKP